MRRIWFSSPSRGSYISTCSSFSVDFIAVSFSSPSRGSYISTKIYDIQMNDGFGSRPLPGVLISLR